MVFTFCVPKRHCCLTYTFTVAFVRSVFIFYCCSATHSLRALYCAAFFNTVAGNVWRVGPPAQIAQIVEKSQR